MILKPSRVCVHCADSDGESDDDDADDEDPVIEHLNVRHMGGVNRLRWDECPPLTLPSRTSYWICDSYAYVYVSRCMPQDSGIVATMADTSAVHIFDLTRSVRSMQARGSPRVQPPSMPAYTFKGHKEEGFALDWSPVTAGQLATGDCAGAIHIWNSTGTDAPSSSWRVRGGATVMPVCSITNVLCIESSRRGGSTGGRGDDWTRRQRGGPAMEPHGEHRLRLGII